MSSQRKTISTLYRKASCCRTGRFRRDDRYVPLWGIEKLTHAGKRFLQPYLPLAKAHVNERRSGLYRQPKVVFAKMAKTCEAFLDDSGEFAALNVNFLYDPSHGSLGFYVGYCNSKLFMFFYDQFFGALRMSGGYYQFQSPQLRVLPFRVPDAKTEQAVGRLVAKIIAAKAKDSEAVTEALEKQMTHFFISCMEQPRTTSAALKKLLGLLRYSPMMPRLWSNRRLSRPGASDNATPTVTENCRMLKF
jgi:hypothetical protein